MSIDLYIWFILIFLALPGIHSLLLISTYIKTQNKKVATPKKFAELPVVAIQIPVFNEEKVIARILNSLLELSYPKNLIHLQILDDSSDRTKEICGEFINKHQSDFFKCEYIHRENRDGYKAGALRNGMNSIDAEYILIMDADYTIKKELLNHTIHHFTDKSLGFVQCCWEYHNRNATFLTRLQAIALDYLMLVEQSVKSKAGMFFSFNGTCGIWRQKN